MTAPLILPNRTETLVQYARNWPTDDAGWTSVDAWCQNASIGANNDMGSAKLYSPSGTVFRPGVATSVLIKSQPIVGKYIRVLDRDPAGTVTNDLGLNFSPIWHGICNTRTIASDDNAFVNSYGCSGIMSVLDSVTPQYHLMEDSAQLVACDIGSPPTFNFLGSKKTGNMSAKLYDFGRGVSAHVFSRTTDPSVPVDDRAKFWTAKDVVEYYLALFAYFADAGPIFSLDGQLTALQWIEKWDLKGHTCGEAISRVLSPKQGIGYRCAIVGTAPVITIKSLSAVDIPVPSTAFAPGFTLPENDEQGAVDLTGDTHIQSFEMVEDGTSTADELSVITSRDHYAVTLSLFDDFDQDWLLADETTWDELKTDQTEAYGTLNTNFGLARVHRRFKLKPTWAGSVVGGFVVPNNRFQVDSVLHGVQGMTGAQTDDALQPRPAAASFMMTSDLPFLDGYDWSTVDPATVDKTRSNAKAMAFAAHTPGEGKWSTLAYFAKGDYSTTSLQIDSDLAAVTFSDDMAEYIKELRDDGLKVYITVGMYAQMENVTSWRRAAIERARDQARVAEKVRPSLGRKVIPAGTVVGVTQEGVLQTTAAEVTIHDDSVLADSVLAISTPWFKDNAWGITYSKKGEIDKTYALPCNMVTSILHYEGDGSTTTETVTGIVSNVSWDFTEPGETKVTTKRIPIDVEPVI